MNIITPTGKSSHKAIGPNMNDGVDFIVGDIHGMYDVLMGQLFKLKFNEGKDRLFSVGDLVDRGPQNIECLKLLDESWFFAVKGNHEDLFANNILGGNGYMHQMNGGQWVADFDTDTLEYWANRCMRLPVAITIDYKNGTKIGITHAEPPMDWDKIEEFPELNAIWGRELITHPGDHIDWNCENVTRTYHGHTPLKVVKQIGNSRFIDTGGCFRGGHLTVESISI